MPLQINIFQLQKKRMFQVRRTFLLIVTFDAIFMLLLWIIYNQVDFLCDQTFIFLFSLDFVVQIKNNNIEQAFTKDVIDYKFSTSLFDVVVRRCSSLSISLLHLLIFHFVFQIFRVYPHFDFLF